MDTQLRSVIIGLGSALPEQEVTNAEISASIVEHGGLTSDDGWVESHTGIVARRIVSNGETASTLGAAAAQAALRHANLQPKDIDEIIVATCTPDCKIPSTACLIHHHLDCRTDAASTDLNGGCSGFVYALRFADRICLTEGKRILVVGTDVLSSVANPSDRKTRPLFGDGAGAVILEPRRSPSGLLDFLVGSDGHGHDLIKVPAGGSALPADTPGLDPQLLYLRMDGEAVFKFATRKIVEIVNTLCRRNGFPTEAIDILAPHQANWRIIELAAKKLGFPLEKILATIRKFANTSAASIPLSLDDAHQCGQLKDGMLVCICGFGAGLTWAGGLIRWGHA